MTTGTIATLWNDLRVWCEEHRPTMLEALAAPVTVPDREALRNCGLPVPESLLDSLDVHDGESDLTEAGLFESGGVLLSAQRMLEHRDMLRESLAGMESDADGEAPPPTLGPLRPMSFNERWLPIMDMNGDVTWYLDFDPAPGGVIGQVIRVDSESAEWIVCAESYEQFVTAYLQDLQQGRIFDAEGELLGDQAWPPLDRIPTLQPGRIALEHLHALGTMGRWDLVPKLIDRVQPPLPPEQHLRLDARRTLSEGNAATASRLLDQIARNYEEHAEDLLLRLDALEAAGDFAKALAAVGAACATRATPELLIRRSKLTMQSAQQAPKRGTRAQMKWLASPAGQQVMATARERAIADYDAALLQSDRIEWQLERIELLLDGARWDEAVVACEGTIERLADAGVHQAEWRQQRAENGLERALARGEGEAEDMMQSLEDVLGQLSGSDIDPDSEPVRELRTVRDAFAQLMQAESQERAKLQAEPDSLRRRACDIAQQLARHHSDVTERFADFDANTLDAKARRYYDKTRDALQTLGFEFCADVEPLRNTETNGNRVLMRLMLSPDRRTVAAIWRLVGPSSTYEVIELESDCADDRMLISNNSGTANPMAQPEMIDLLSLPFGTHAKQLLEAHQARLPAATRPILDREAVLALQERQRLIKREAARQRGWVSESELRGLLGASYAELGPAVREQLSEMLES